MQHKTPNAVDTFIDNLSYLMRKNGVNQSELGRKSGVSQKSISNMLGSKQTPSIDSLDKLAEVFNLEGWHLLMPNLPDDLKNDTSIERLYHFFVNSTSEGREHIERVAEREARYSVNEVVSK